ncbi:MAG: family 20 glycosylhydrolase [Planctomycetota bacterium]
MSKRPCAMVLLALILSLACGAAVADNPLKLLPTPKVLKVDGGQMPLTAQGRIVATDPKLKPLADILAAEILLVAGFQPAVVEAAPQAGDIVLSINPKLQADAEILTVHGQDVVRTREYAHTIAVTDRVAIEGWDYRAVCEGTATLLQAIVLEGGKASVPKMTVKDWPFSDYGSIMIDCARQYQPVYILKVAVETCRMFKIRYLHLHLHDDNAYTFPSKAYPEANTKGGLPPYKLEDLKDLVAYADARGVTCVPEIEGPGHCTSLLDGMGGKLGDVKNRTMDVLNPNIYPILDTLVGEMCEVFKSSPYIHFGGDEVEPAWYLGNAHVKQYMKEHNLTGEHTIWLTYGQNIAKIARKHGKKAIMWDGLPVGVPKDPSLAKDIILYTWFPRASETLTARDLGYTTITAPWDMPPFPEFNIFTCNGAVLKRDDKVLGHCRPMWEMSQEALALGYLTGAPERHERTWGPDSVIEEDYHKNRMAKQNARTFMIVRPVTITVDGAVKDKVFAAPITVSMSTVVPGGQIRYRLDAQEPTIESPLYEKPFQAAEGLAPRAAVFDKDGKKIGLTTVGESLRYIPFEPSLTTGKPVEASGGKSPDEKAEYVVDGMVDGKKFWGTIPAPQWFKIDLQKEYSVDRVQVVPYFDGARYYQYTVEISTDGQAWTQVVDASKNAAPGTEKGYMHKFAPAKARYIRVNMLKNSDNPAVHLVEVRAFEAGK